MREAMHCGTPYKENAVRMPTGVVRMGAVGLSCSTSCAMRRAREESACLMGQVPCEMTPLVNFQVTCANGSLHRGYGFVIPALVGVCRCYSPWASTGS